MSRHDASHEQITGLVLAGGRGSRMGGVDKGLQNHHGMPLALHALLRLQPQVGEVMINANRNLGAYEAMGVPVWPDALRRLSRPAGRHAGRPGALRDAVPGHACRATRRTFRSTWSQRLAAGAGRSADAEIAMAATREDGELVTQPVFCLLKAALMESLVEYLQSGERKIDRWTALHRCVQVEFDASAFDNANTVEELQRLQRGAA